MHRVHAFGGSKFSYSDLLFVSSSDIIIIPECAELVGKYCFFCMQERQTKGSCARHLLLHNSYEFKHSDTTSEVWLGEWGLSPRPKRTKHIAGLQIRGAKTSIRSDSSCSERLSMGNEVSCRFTERAPWRRIKRFLRIFFSWSTLPFVIGCE